MGGYKAVKYVVTVGDKAYKIEVGSEREIEMDGISHQVDIQDIDGYSLFSLLLDNRSYELIAEREGEEFRILLEGEMYNVRVTDERAGRLMGAPTRVPSGEVAIKAPMPGLVVAVPATLGQEVKIGQGLIILEAMKMENELRVPRAGRVKAIRVSPGQVVDKDQVLVVIE
jgi:biotin carboxyl carrier protein